MTEGQREPGSALTEREKFHAEVANVRAQREVVGTRSVDDGMLRSVTTRGTGPALVFSLLGAFGGWLMAHDAALTGRDPTEGRWLQSIFLIAAGLSLAWRYAGPWRLRRDLSALPFPVIGFLELIADDWFDHEPTIELVFADTPARIDDVLELVRAKLPVLHEVGRPWVEQRERRIAITLQGGQSARFAFMIWFRLLCRNLLRDLHRAYPLARVEVISGSRRQVGD